MATLALTNETRGHYNYLYARVPARGSAHVCSRLTCLTCLTEVSLYRVSDDGLGVISAEAGAGRSPEPSGFSILHLGPGRGGDMLNTQKRY